MPAGDARHQLPLAAVLAGVLVEIGGEAEGSGPEPEGEDQDEVGAQVQLGIGTLEAAAGTLGQQRVGHGGGEQGLEPGHEILGGERARAGVESREEVPAHDRRTEVVDPCRHATQEPEDRLAQRRAPPGIARPRPAAQEDRLVDQRHEVGGPRRLRQAEPERAARAVEEG